MTSRAIGPEVRRESSTRARPTVHAATLAATLLAGTVLSTSSCAGPDAPAGRAELSVFAASSLTDAFAALEAAFERANPDVDVVVSYAGSQVLRLQIEQGARAHVFASANEDHARALADAGLAEAPELLAYNRLVIIVPPDNPAGIESLADLPSASRLVVASETVPLGRYTRGMLERAGRPPPEPARPLPPDVRRPPRRYGPDFLAAVRASIVSEENNARLVRAKVELGEADAAIVYRTDALASDRVRTIELPNRYDFSTRYVISTVHGPDGSVDTAAVRFVRFARSEQGRALLREHGFVTEADGEGA